jgi:hypothetical protein
MEKPSMLVIIFQAACFALSSELVIEIPLSGLLNLFFLFIAVQVLVGYIIQLAIFLFAEKSSARP